MATFLIGGNGLERIGGEPISIYPGSMMHYGYSDSPIWVATVDDKWVTFFRYPYGDKKSQREQIHIFRNIAQKGTTTKLKSLNRLEKMYGANCPEWFKELQAHYVAILKGETGRTWDRDDIRMVKVKFKYTGEGDGWRKFEESYAHSVSGMDNNGVMESYDFNKADAAELCHKMNCGMLPGFEFLGMTERDE